MGQNKKSFGKVVFTIPEKGRIIKWRKLVEKRNVYFLLQRRRKRRKYLEGKYHGEGKIVADGPGGN